MLVTLEQPEPRAVPALQVTREPEEAEERVEPLAQLERPAVPALAGQLVVHLAQEDTPVAASVVVRRALQAVVSQVKVAR